MNDINTLDLKMLISNAIKEIYDTMFSMEVAPSDGIWPDTTADNSVVGSVSFAGDVMGSVYILLHDKFARLMTARMFDQEIDEIDGQEEVHDVVGELCNMVGGDLKSRLCDNGFPCSLSIPSVTSGNGIKVESKGWGRKEQFGYKHGEHTALVAVYMKSGE